MKARRFALISLLVMMFVGVALFGTAQAQVTGITGSDVSAFFGSQSDVVQVSNPIGLNPWPPAGPNPPLFYSSISQLPGVPAPPAGNVPPSNVTPFAPTPSPSSFNDGFGNTATSTILGSVTALSLTADDAQVNLVAGGMTLTESTGGYAYEQLNYDIDYTVSNVVNATGTVGTLSGLVTRSYSVSGTIGTGSGAFVAFGGAMNFWDATTNTSLGAPLLFNYFNGAGGAFSSTVTGSSIIAAVNSPDVLRITGDFFLIGDPSTINVQSVPEPSSVVLLVLGSLGLLALGRQRRTVS